MKISEHPAEQRQGQRHRHIEDGSDKRDQGHIKGWTMHGSRLRANQ